MTAVPPESGVYTPIPTFFKKNNTDIDFDTQIKHAKFLQKNGIKGLVIMGSTGENGHLTRSERFQIVHEIHSAIPDFTIIGGVAQNSIEDTVEEIASLKKGGAKYVVVLPSNYFGASIKQAGIVDWFTSVADKSELPVLIYVYPGVANNIHVDPKTIKQLSSHPNIVGTKISHGDVSHHTILGLDPEVKARNFKVFTGLGQILLPVLMVGCQGTIDALSGAFPKIYVKLFKLVEEKKFDQAAKLQFTISKGEELVAKFGVIGIKKVIHDATGFGESYLGRAPLNQDLSQADWDSYNDYYSEIFNTENTL